MRLFVDHNPIAERQRRTDRLVLDRLLLEMAKNKQLDDQIPTAHEVIKKWASLEASGKLASKSETQLQGDFLAEVFGQALGYARMVDNGDQWHQVQHEPLHGQVPDATLGFFSPSKPAQPLAVVELKGPKVHLDRDRSNGRTAVDQCWDYLVNMPRECRWGIVSNMVSFRLYERDSTKRAYEHFSLESLVDGETFRKFYTLFHRKGLIESTAGIPPRAVRLIEKTDDRQRAVGDELYEHYSRQRTELITQLHHTHKYPLAESIEMAQRLFDRVIFIAFCEDRKLLPADTLKNAYSSLPAFSAAENPRWQNYKTLFRFVDKGSDTYKIAAYNGGLFAHHAVDDIELPDKPITDFFRSLGGYDFADEVNLDVLGHLFERSITELEKLRQSGLFGGDEQKARDFAQMPQSAKRKQMGTYYTPAELTSRIVTYTVEETIAERLAALAVRHGFPETEAKEGKLPESEAFWREALDVLRAIKVVDPACGSGAFLFQAYDAFELRYNEVLAHLQDEHLAEKVPAFILNENIYGVDLSAEAVEIAQLALWIRSAAPGQTLAVLSSNIVQGNSLVDDTAVHPEAFGWRERFPEVFDRPGYQNTGGGFDCVIGNPPWERMKLQEREFFALPAPEIATATNAAERRRLVAKLQKENLGLHERYEDAKAAASAMLDHCRTSGRYPLVGKGDINFYSCFVELASQIVAPAGRVGMLVPSGIASDMTTKDLFASVAETGRLVRLFDFENRLKVYFPEVDGRFKFCIFNFVGSAIQNDATEFVFFAHRVEDLENKKRRVRLSGEDIALLNPNTRTCPIFRSRRDAEITKAIYRRIPVLVDQSRKSTGDPWGISFQRMFDQTNDAELFVEPKKLLKLGYKLRGNVFEKGKKRYFPLYEAKMVQAYDHRAASVTTELTNWVRQGQTTETTLVQHQNPEFAVLPRYWVDAKNVDSPAWGTLGFKDITSPTNQRTMIASFAPNTAYTNHFVLIRSARPPEEQAFLLANLNSVVLDYCTRQKIGGVTLNFFIVEQLPALTPDAYDEKCPWSPRMTLRRWLLPRVLKLSCTSEDMLPLADECRFTSGSIKAYDGRLHKWNDKERADLMAELDAAFFILYGVEREDVSYILGTFSKLVDPVPYLHGKSIADLILEHFDGLSAAAMAR